MLSIVTIKDSLSSIAEKFFGIPIIKKTPKKLYIFLFAAAVGIAVRKVMIMRKKRNRLEYSKKKKDIVILHQFPRSTVLPSFSPFVLKLETYLRMAKIPYENDYSDWRGPKGKCPFITLNGVDMGDSQLIIEFLNEKYNIHLSAKLSNEEKAVARALRIMAEDHLFWCIALYHWVLDDSQSILKVTKWPYPMRPFIFPLIGRITKTNSWSHGIGRHTRSEILDMAKNDVFALSVYLGNKKFFMGNEPTEVDCALFGFIAQLMYIPIPEVEKAINEDMKNIKEYCKRMKERYWPDWN